MSGNSAITPIGASEACWVDIHQDQRPKLHHDDRRVDTITQTTEQEPRRRIPEDVSEELGGYAHEKNNSLTWFVNLFAESVSLPGPLELELSGVNVTRLIIEAFDSTGGVGDMAVGYSAHYPRTDIWMWGQPKTDKQPAQRVQHTWETAWSTVRQGRRLTRRPRGLTIQQRSLRYRGHQVEHPDTDVRHTVMPRRPHPRAATTKSSCPAHRWIEA
jgi:hypothetical protein